MAESDVERLTRISAACEQSNKYIADPRDIKWLLDQVSGEREYRVEYRPRPPCDPLWNPYARRFVTVDAARAEIQRIDREHGGLANRREWADLRVMSAPVQVWTPVEEE